MYIKPFFSSYFSVKIGDENIEPNAFSRRDRGRHATRAPVGSELCILCFIPQCHCLMISRKHACNVKIMKQFPFWSGGNKKLSSSSFSVGFCTMLSLLSVQFIFSESKTEHSSPLNPFVSLFSPPFFSPVHMQPPEMDRDKKSKASSSKSLCL